MYSQKWKKNLQDVDRWTKQFKVNFVRGTANEGQEGDKYLTPEPLVELLSYAEIEDAIEKVNVYNAPGQD